MDRVWEAVGGYDGKENPSTGGQQGSVLTGHLWKERTGEQLAKASVVLRCLKEVRRGGGGGRTGFVEAERGNVNVEWPQTKKFGKKSSFLGVAWIGRRGASSTWFGGKLSSSTRRSVKKRVPGVSDETTFGPGGVAHDMFEFVGPPFIR